MPIVVRLKLDPRAFQKLDKTKAAVREVVFASHLDLDRALRDRTPFDTGYAANSWFAMANGSPSPGEGFESPGRGASDPGVILASVGGVLTMANTAEYIGPLNRGHSKQAPAGWVESTANLYDDFLAKHVMQANARNR